MTTKFGLSLPTLNAARNHFLRRVDTLPGNRVVREEATRRLRDRLALWQGAQISSGRGRFKNKIARGQEADCVVGADEAEILIVRAIAVTNGDSQFTMSPNGAVFSTDGNGWTINQERIYISGLSLLVDDAADILQQMRNSEGGRMFFTRDAKFINAPTKRAFLSVTDGDSPPFIRSRSRTEAGTASIDSMCPECFQVLPASGVCGYC